MLTPGQAVKEQQKIKEYIDSIRERMRLYMGAAFIATYLNQGHFTPEMIARINAVTPLIIQINRLLSRKWRVTYPIDTPLMPRNEEIVFEFLNQNYSYLDYAYLNHPFAIAKVWDALKKIKRKIPRTSEAPKEAPVMPKKAFRIKTLLETDLRETFGKLAEKFRSRR